MSLVDIVRFQLPRLDPRTPREIADDLDEEFAFHLEQIERELREEGRDPEAAGREARRRFGDVDRIKAQCTRIVLGERIMLQRASVVLLVVVLFALGFLSVQVFLTQRSSERSLAVITDRLSNMGPTEMAGTVIVEGDIPRPALYAVPRGDEEFLLLHELLEQSGGLRSGQQVRVGQLQADRTMSTRTLEAAALTGPDPQKVILRPGDAVRVITPRPDYTPHERAQLDALPGWWRPADIDKPPFSPEASLDIVPADDLMNLTGSPMGTLVLPPYGRTRLVFREGGAGGRNLEILDRIQRRVGGQAFGRWVLQDGELTLNIARFAPDHPDFQTPIVFVRVDDGGEGADTGNGTGRPAVTVFGVARRPGRYPIPPDRDLMLAGLLAAAGGTSDRVVTIDVRRLIDGEMTTVFQKTIDTTGGLDELDLALRPDDRVLVSTPLDEPAE